MPIVLNTSLKNLPTICGRIKTRTRPSPNTIHRAVFCWLAGNPPTRWRTLSPRWDQRRTEPPTTTKTTIAPIAESPDMSNIKLAIARGRAGIGASTSWNIPTASTQAKAKSSGRRTFSGICGTAAPSAARTSPASSSATLPSPMPNSMVSKLTSAGEALTKTVRRLNGSAINTSTIKMPLVIPPTSSPPPTV